MEHPAIEPGAKPKRRLTTINVDPCSIASIQLWLDQQQCEVAFCPSPEAAPLCQDGAIECMLVRWTGGDDLLHFHLRGDGRLNRIPIIYIVGEHDVEHAIHLLKEGAMDVLSGQHTPARLIEAIDRAWRYSASLMAQQSSAVGIQERLASLTGRERQVLKYLLEGLLNKQVAGMLNISESTVKAHRRNILCKAGVRTLIGLARCLSEAGIEPCDLLPKGESAPAEPKPFGFLG